MNLPQFLKEIDEMTNCMSKRELIDFIHDMARVLPGGKRPDFLYSLNKSQEEVSTVSKREYESNNVILQKYEDIRKGLKSIEEGELCLEGSLNYEYDDWYNRDEDEFIFSDPEGVVAVIEEACEFVYQCIDCEEYVYAYNVVEILIGLKIDVCGEAQDYLYETPSIDELNYYNLSDLDYKELVIDGLYVSYLTHDLQDRAEALYRIFEKSGQQDITLEMLMQNREELLDIDEFLPVWIRYLVNLITANAQKLLKEALKLTNDSEIILENARKYCDLHPALYELYLESNLEIMNSKILYIVGKEALDAIDIKYIVRSRIAKIMSILALKQGEKEEAEKCWLEVFRSDIKIVNFLRLMKECTDYSMYSDEVQKVCHKMYSRIGSRSHIIAPDGELKENIPDETTVYLLAFFCGEFQYVRERAMNVTESLGWSSTFMKCGLAAFLLLLLEQDDLSQACKEMCNKVVMWTGFNREEYEDCLDRNISDGNQEWFWKCFNIWKKMIVLSDDDKQQYMVWVEKLIEKRVKGIMERNYRNYYNECAGYVAALGEVRESRGEPGAKQKVLLEYKSLYSRRNAFHRELRVYGMRDSKKK